jgi:putative redox protein
MIARTEWKGEELFEGLTESGNRLMFDGSSSHSGGPSPMETVLMALCSCSSIDVVNILQKKRQPFTSLTASATAEQASESPRYFTHIRLVYKVGGKVSRKAVEDAVALSKDKYCSVSAMLEKTAKIEFLIEYVDGEPLE